MAVGIRALFYDDRHHTRFVKLFVARRKGDKKIVLFCQQCFFSTSAHTQSLLRHIPTKWYVKKSRLVYKHAPKPLYITINSKLGGHTTSRYNTNQGISICGPVGSTSVRDSSTRQSSRLLSVDLRRVVTTRKMWVVCSLIWKHHRITQFAWKPSMKNKCLIKDI